MALGAKMGKHVKPRVEPVEDENESDDSSPSIIETGDVDGILSSDEDEDPEGIDEEDESDAQAQRQLSSISFGTLAKAQESLSSKRKRGSDSTPQQEDKLEALRARLRELKEQKGHGDKKKTKSTNEEPRSKRTKVEEAAGSDVDQDSDEEDDAEDDGARKSRTSKHAPASQPSNRQVTRKRTVVDAPKRHIRDPRFGPMSGPVDEAKLDQNYSFLNDYQTSEMAELKVAIKKSKNEEEKEKLKRALVSMQNKRKSKEAKEREQQVLREHRRKEKEAISQGKQPFYLKKSEQKKLAVVEKFNSMKGKDREKLMERRRKKAAGKEKKMMPEARRIVG